MIARDAIISLAATHLGELETPTNSNLISYAHEYGIPGQAWCAAFVSSIYKAAGIPLPGIGRPEGFVYCPYGVTYARQNGQAVEVGQGQPAPGDIVFFSWDMTKWPRFAAGVGDHVGIVTGYNAGTVHTIEGNAGNPGGVYRFTRPEAQVVCYWRPPILDDDFAPVSVPVDVTDQDFDRIDTLFSRSAADLHKAVVESLAPQFDQLNGNLEALIDTVRAAPPRAGGPCAED